MYFKEGLAAKCLQIYSHLNFDMKAQAGVSYQNIENIFKIDPKLLCPLTIKSVPSLEEAKMKYRVRRRP